MFFRKKNTEEESGSLSKQTWARFRRNKPAMGGLLFILFACIVSVLGYLITPDDSPYANDQKPELHIKSPGFEARLLAVRRNQEKSDQNFLSKILFGNEPDFDTYALSEYKFSGPDILIREYTGNSKSAGDWLGFNTADVTYALDTRFPVQFDSTTNTITFLQYGETKPLSVQIEKLRRMITEEHIVTKKYLLGTDLLGRDMLSRLMIGTRISLAVGMISVLISIFIGIVLGALAGYFRGWTDAFITWFLNVVWSIPTLLLVIAITLVLGKGITQVFIAVGLTMWVEVARIVRGQILSIREKEYVEAARALGYTHRRIIFRHILPNVMGPVIVMAAGNFAAAILVEAGLSFLGIGAQPPLPSWGEMINAHHGYILMDKAYLAFIPGIAIMSLVLSFMLVGDGLRDAMDTRGTDEMPLV